MGFCDRSMLKIRGQLTITTFNFFSLFKWLFISTILNAVH